MSKDKNSDMETERKRGQTAQRCATGRDLSVTAASGVNAALAEHSNETMAGQCETQDVGIDSLRSTLTLLG